MLGQVGLIHRVNVDEDKTKLFFRGHGVGIIVAAKALKRVCCIHSIFVDLFFCSSSNVCRLIQVEGTGTNC